MPSSDDILKQVDASENLINKLVVAWRDKQWVRLCLLFGFLSLAFLNPALLSKGIQFLLSNPRWETPQWYFYVWLVTTLALFVAAFLTALFTRSSKLPVSPSPTSIIKGLRPYTREDSELFTKLQRGRILQDCLGACTDDDFRFGILYGESGTGKTSFLQAGLCPALEKRDYRPVYIKLTNELPFDSIRQILSKLEEVKVEDSEPEPKTLLELFRKTTNGSTKPVVLILDQFEQYFANYKSKADRDPFIQEMALWYEKRASLPVKILISIRGDFLYRLGDFQERMGYTLAPQDTLRLEKFEPKEAANIFRVIAEEEKIECDENFIEEITTNELSSRDDGLVSPVDVQVLSWMIAGRKAEDEKGFTRKAFQMLGGVEGLLESFLKRILDARETETRRQNAIKVLLALTDLNRNTRAGALSLDDLKTELQGSVSAKEVEEAVTWLSSGGVRLLTPVDQQPHTTYELAHERLIPALRKLADKELTNTDRASQILDRRYNEWAGNNHSWRYLLTFKEWRLINSNKALISWEPKRAQKELFFSKSKRWFVQGSVIAISVVLLTLGGYQAYRLYEARPEAQISQLEEQLYTKLERGNFTALEDAVLLTPVLDSSGEDKLLNEKIWQLVGKLDNLNRTRIITPLTVEYHERGQRDKALELLAQIEADVDNHRDSSERVNVPIRFADLCIKLGEKDKALRVLSTVESDVRRFQTDYDDLDTLAKSYKDAGREDKSLQFLEELHNTTKDFPVETKHVLVTNLAARFSELEPTDRVLNYLSEYLSSSKDTTYHGNVIRACLEAYAKIKQPDKALPLLSRLEVEIYQLFEYPTRHEAIIELAVLYGKFGQRDKSLGLFAKVQQELATEHPRTKALMSISLADAYMELGSPYEGLKLISQVREETKNLDSKFKLEILARIIEFYVRRDQRKEALLLLEQSETEIEKSDEDLITYGSLIDSYSKLDQRDQELAFLAKIQDKAKSSAGRGTLFTKIATRYAALGEWKKAREVANDTGDESAQIIALIRVLAIWKSPGKDIFSNVSIRDF